MFQRTGIVAAFVLVVLFMTVGCVNVRRQVALIEPTFAYTRDAAPQPVRVASVSRLNDNNQ